MAARQHSTQAHAGQPTLPLEDRCDPAHVRASAWLWAVLPAACALLLLYARWSHLFLNYAIYGDDFAVLRGALGSPVQWFTQGFSRYFLLFPEWTPPYTDFLRPGVSALMRLEHALFHQHFAWYFALYYAADFAMAALAVLVALHYRVARGYAALLGLLVAFSPAFIDTGQHSIAFAFDIWCGLFCLCGFYLAITGRWAWAVISLTLAVFTKETAFYAPVAAAVSCFLVQRRRWLAAWQLLPLLLYGFCHHFIFSAYAGGIYAVQGNRLALMLGIVKGLLQWPSGVPDPQALRALVHAHAGALANLDLYLYLENLLLWALLLYLGWAAARARKAKGACAAILVTTVVWLAGALAFAVAVTPDSRFGGSVYWLEPLLAVLCLTWMPAPRQRSAATALLVLLAATFTLHYARSDRFRADPASGATTRLLRSLHALPAATQTVYVLDGPVTLSSADSITAAAGSHAHMVMLNEIAPCDTQAFTTRFDRQGAKVHITQTAPPCSEIVFPGVPPAMLEKGLGAGTLPRGTLATYQFPQGRISGQGLRNAAAHDVDAGRQMDLLLHPAAGPYAILYYDGPHGTFQCWGPGC